MKSITTAATLIMVLVSQSSFALVPPLSQAQREAFATDIVTGYVTGIKKEIKEEHYGTNALYTVKLLVLGSKKGGLKNNETIQFSYWKADYRPHGWCGASGQYGKISQYTDIQAYLEKDETTGLYTLLSPNGFEEVQLQ